MTIRTFVSKAVLLTSIFATGDLLAEEGFVPPPEVKKTVDAFAGRWSLEGTVTMPGAQPKKVALKMECKKTAKGKAVACSFSGMFDGSALVAYDFYSKAVHFMAVTSDDEIHDHKCHWQGDGRLTCDALKGGMAGMAITEDLTFIVGSKKLGFNGVIAMPDGGKASCEFMSR